MTNFLFWNINKKDVSESIAKLANLYEIDVLMFAECEIDPPTLLAKLNHSTSEYHFVPQFLCERIAIYTRFTAEFIKPQFDTDKITIRRLNLPGKEEVLLAITHLPSKLYYEDVDQLSLSYEVAGLIRSVEERVGHARTILVGDFNMNPFDDGVITANGLHAVMSRKVAERQFRSINAKNHYYFYNPMWNLLGDFPGKIGGTYYYPQSTYKAFFWHLFDQVLIRPSLVQNFVTQNLEIIQSDGVLSFLTGGGIPNADVASDHLPIRFTFNF
jgi:hypothetical protein